MSIPLIKTAGRSYNPVWYSQSLCELIIDGEDKKFAHILSGCGSESKVIQYKLDLTAKTMIGIQSAFTKSIPSALVQLNSQYYACASSSEIEFIDITSGMCVSSIQP